MSRFIWSDFDENSEWSLKARDAKNRNQEDFWPIMREVIDHDCDTLPLTRFRLWASLALIPLVERSKRWKFMGAAFNGANRWTDVEKALEENWVGIPDTFAREELGAIDDFNTSMHRVQNVGHLMLCRFNPFEIARYKSIVEIGAGYGDMCDVIHKMGFTGKYTIYDFPEVQRVQKYYLENNNIKDVNYISEPDQLETADLIIGTWSISEIPMELREKIMSRIKDSPNWLVAYQDNAFNGAWTNSDYFHTFFENKKYLENIIRYSDYDGSNFHLYINDFSRERA